MNRSQSLKAIPSGDSDLNDEKRAASQPNLAPDAPVAREGTRSTRSTIGELRRKIVHLNKELEQERIYVKQLRREKSFELRHIREDEQRKASTQLTELRSKLHKDKVNEVTALKEQMHKDKEKEIVQIIKQKDELLRNAQHDWAKEKEELKVKLKAEVWSEAREDAKKDFERERVRLEQEIVDLRRQRKETEEALKITQEADKRKADEIRRIFHEHEIQMEKFKRNSWQESRRQMSEIRQLLNIVEQLERKLGFESGHITKLRLQKEELYDELRKKASSFDAWDNMMSTTMKGENNEGEAATPPRSPDKLGANQELRILQRKNIELSSLVKKLDEKNQQLSTRNAELLSEQEKSDKENRDKNKRLDRKNQELLQNNKKLENKNKLLQEELNSLKKKSTASGKDVSGKKGVRPRGQPAEKEEFTAHKQQIKEQAKTIEGLKQNLMEKERRIDLLRERNKNSKKALKMPRASPTSLSVDSAAHPDDDAGSVYSDISDFSNMSSVDSGLTTDSKRFKKLTKELLALERAYALLQAQVGSTMDVERDEMERQQLQSDLIESQARIHELERMLDSSTQVGVGELNQLQKDNKALYHKLIAAEAERDLAVQELGTQKEDLKDLRDQKDLLEFELEEISQLSCAGSEDEFSPRRQKPKGDVDAPLTMEEVKACLEEMENEKKNVLNAKELEALKSARTNLGIMSQRINRLEATESILRSKVKDFEERPLQSPPLVETAQEVEMTEASVSFDNDSILENNTRKTSTEITLADLVYFEKLEVEHHELLLEKKRRHDAPILGGEDKVDINKVDEEVNTDLDVNHLLQIKEENEKLMEEKYELQEKYNEVDSERENLLQEKQDLLQEKQELERVLQGKAESEDNFNEMDSERKVLSQEREDLEKKLNELDSERKTLLQEREEIEENFKEIVSEHNKLLKDKEELEDKFNEVEYERSKVLQERDDFEEKMNEMESERTILLQERAELEENVHQELESYREKLLHENEEWRRSISQELDAERQTFLQEKVAWESKKNEQMESERDNILEETKQWTEKMNRDIEIERQNLLLEREKWQDAINEKLEAEQELLLQEKEMLQELASRAEVLDNETETMITMHDIEHLEEIKDDHEQCLEDYKRREAEALHKVDQAIETEMDHDYLDYLQNLEGEHENLLQEKANLLERTNQLIEEREKMAREKEELRSKLSEEMEDVRESLLQEKERELESTKELIEEEREKLQEERAEFHNKLNEEMKKERDAWLQEKVEWEDNLNVQREKERELLEEMVNKLKYERETLLKEKDSYRGANNRINIETTHCDVETNLKMADIEYLENIDDLHRHCVDHDNETIEKHEIETTTELTMYDIGYLEDVEKLHESCETEDKTLEDSLVNVPRGTDNKGTETELLMPDIHYLEEVDTVHQHCTTEQEADASERTDSSETENVAVETELTSSVLEYLEEVAATHEDIVREYKAFRKSVTKPKEDVAVMTEMTSEHLDYLGELALRGGEVGELVSGMDRAVQEQQETSWVVIEGEKSTKAVNTELEAADLDYLEEVKELYEESMDIKEQTIARSEADSMTDLTFSHLDDLYATDEAYKGLKNSGALSKLEELNKPRVEVETLTDVLMVDIGYLEEVETLYNEQQQDKVDVCTETDITAADVSRLENLANNAKSDHDLSPKRLGVQVYEEIVTEGVVSSVESTPDDLLDLVDGKESGVDAAVQCELVDLLGLVQELQRQEGGADPAWHVTAMNINRQNQGGYDPVEVVMRNHPDSSTPLGRDGLDRMRQRPTSLASLDKRHSSNMSLNLDYTWRSNSSLDATSVTYPAGARQLDSPQVPLAPYESFDLSDLESVASEQCDEVPPMHDVRDSAVAKFDRFMIERRESELNTLEALKDGVDHLDGQVDKHPDTIKTVQQLMQENDFLRGRIQDLEHQVRGKILNLEGQKGDLSVEEMEMLRRKVEQLKEAERQMEALHESNIALKEKIEHLNEGDSEKTVPEKTEGATRDNWSAIDPSDLPGKTEQGTQAGPGAGVSQEIQTTGDLLKLIELSHDGSIPEHIRKELEKLKAENRELYEELMDLRRLKLAAATPSFARRASDEALANALKSSRHPAGRRPDTTPDSAPRDPVEEPIKSTRRQQSESAVDWSAKFGEELLPLDESRARPPTARRDLEEVFNFAGQREPVRKSATTSAQMIDEPFFRSASASDRSLETADLERQLQELDVDTIDSGVVEFGDDGSPPPPPPTSLPPPLPTGAPPGISDMADMEEELEAMLSDTSPLRDSKALRAQSRPRTNRGFPHEAPMQQQLVDPGLQSEVVPQPEEFMSVQEEPALVGVAPMGSRSVGPKMVRPQPTQASLTDVTRLPDTPKRAPPPTLPKPKMPGQRRGPSAGSSYPGGMRTPLSHSRGSLDDDSELLPAFGSVRSKASAINQGELDAMNEKIRFLERQLKNKDNVLKTMKTEAAELESQALLERRTREIKILEEDIAFLKQENQKQQRDILAKIGELNRKSYEVEQWKAEANNSERQRKRIEVSYLNLQTQARNLYGVDSKLNDIQTKYTESEKEKSQLAEKVKKLEKSEKEFKQLEYNISVLQNQLADMESVEQERDSVMSKLRDLEEQREDLLRKGRMVETERNDFLRNNKIMEMQRDELEERYATAQKTLTDWRAKVGDADQTMKECQNKVMDAQHERNFAQAQFKKMESENSDLQRRLTEVTHERNSLEGKVAELQDLNREHVKLEEGFHTLRLKVADLTRQKEDLEMQIPTLKAKVSLLKKVCKEKDDFIEKLNEEIKELRHAIATSTLDDLSKIRSYGYSPENYVKFAGTRDSDRYNGKTEDLIEARLQADVEASPASKSKSSLTTGKRHVALFDYDPNKASVSGHPELELPLKEGDDVMVLSEMDMNGYHDAEVNGVRGLVSSLYIDEAEDSHVPRVGHRDARKSRKGSPAKVIKPSAYDTVSSGHSTMSGGSSYTGSDPRDRQCFVALCDYNPYQQCTTGRPELELPLKKGDILTVTGDMDVHGYYRAEMDGQTGLVPSTCVEEVSSSSFLQSSSSKAPEQILGMFDNIKVPRSGRSPLPPSPRTPRLYHTYPSPGGSIVPITQVAQPVMSAISKDTPIKPIFTPHLSPEKAEQLSAPILNGHALNATSASNVNSPPQLTTHARRSAGHAVSKPRAHKSKPLALQTSSSGIKTGAPLPPGRLQVLRPVNNDALLVGWTLPGMDEFGRSNGIPISGYKIYVNGEYKMDVRSQLMTKALVDHLDLRYPVQLGMMTVGADGSLSSEVSSTFTDTITNSRMPLTKAIEDSADHTKLRTFVALYDYNPVKSSPNVNPEFELAFNEGDILRVEDTSRKDGFFFGSFQGRKGLIPSNFVEEVAVAQARTPIAKATKRQNSRPLPITSGPRRAVTPTSPTSPAHSRQKMFALYDYYPETQSPLGNPSAEMAFKKGQVVTVLGRMNSDGFYLAEIAGRRGLVPASFLESSPETPRRVAFDKKPRS